MMASATTGAGRIIFQRSLCQHVRNGHLEWMGVRRLSGLSGCTPLFYGRTSGDRGGGGWCSRSVGVSVGRTVSTHAQMNTIINFVPQQEAWVVERMGRYHKILEPGLNILVPIVDRIKYVQSLKEIAIEIPQQGAITVDNVALHLDGVLYLKVLDPFKASYGVEDPEFAISQLAQTTMRSEVGKISLDTVFRERETLNINIVAAINKAAEPWGLVCLRYEIRDMKMPPKIQEAMQMQVEAERRKRAKVLESEGLRESAVNVAEGDKKATILASEAQKQEQINRALGEAEAILAKAKARADGLQLVANALHAKAGGDAAALIVAEQYVQAFGKLAKETNTLVLSSNAADAGSMVAQAMTVYKTLAANKSTER